MTIDTTRTTQTAQDMLIQAFCETLAHNVAFSEMLTAVEARRLLRHLYEFIDYDEMNDNTVLFLVHEGENAGHTALVCPCDDLMAGFDLCLENARYFAKQAC